MLLAHLPVDVADLDVLAMQLTAALEVPLLLYAVPHDLARSDEPLEGRLARGWEDLVGRLVGGS